MRGIHGLTLLLLLPLPLARALPPETFYTASIAAQPPPDQYYDDYGWGPFPIGFTFTYYGNSYTQFYVSSNGFIGFGSSNGYVIYDETSIPNASTPNNVIYAFWDDIIVRGDGAIYYYTIGSSPNRKLVVQCTNMGFCCGPSPLGTLSFILYEGTNQIQMQYRLLLNVHDVRSHGADATVGVENGSGSAAVQVSYHVAGLASEMAIRVTPGSGTYTYNAGALYEPILLGGAAMPPSIPALLTPGDDATVCLQPTFAWSDSEGATSYTLKYSTDATFSNGIIDVPMGSATSYTPDDALELGATYYWAVLANNAGGVTWSEIHRFDAEVDAPPSASDQTVWAALGSDTVILLNGLSCGGSLTGANVTSLPAHGALYQYDQGNRGPVISSVPAGVTDPDRHVMYFVNDGVAGLNRGNFDFTVVENGNESASALITINTYAAPAVVTSAATNITDTSADLAGEVVADNGSAVTERGLCWGQNPSPGISGTHHALGSGVGTFNYSVTTLTGATRYYVRAYAINENGTAYGNQVTFRTNGRPTVSTGTATAITSSSATLAGTVSDDGGATVTRRGVCWSTDPNATTANDHADDGSPGLGTFTAPATGLTPNTTYHVRAYAENSYGLTYGSDRTFITLAIHTITFAAGAHGSLTGTLSQTVDHGGSTSAVSVLPGTGYHFVNWTAAGFSSTDNPLTLNNVTADQSLTANFAINTYTLTYTAAAHGSISGTSPQTIDYGGSGTAVTAVPDNGYHFVQWSDNSTANPRTDTDVQADITVAANFAIDTHTITFVAGAHGSLTGTLSQTVDYGGSTTAVTAVPDTGYHFENWTADGFSSTDNPLTLTNVTVARTITAHFGPDAFTVTFVAGTGGNITGVAAQSVLFGEPASAVAAAPATGYQFVNWTGPAGFTSTDNPLTYGPVAANATITANFSVNSCIVSFVAGPNGSIAGAAVQTVSQGGSTTAVTAIPDTGYHFENWTADGFSATDNPLTLTNVTQTLQITAGFAVDPPAPAEPVTAPDLRIAIESQAGSESVTTGAEVGFVISVDNVGTGAATDVRVIVPLPPEVELLDVVVNVDETARLISAPVTVVDGNVVIELASVPPNGHVTVQLTLKANAPGSFALIADVQSAQTSQPAATPVAAALDVADEYLQVLRLPAPLLCGSVGVSPVLILLGLMGLRRKLGTRN